MAAGGFAQNTRRPGGGVAVGREDGQPRFSDFNFFLKKKATLIRFHCGDRFVGILSGWGDAEVLGLPGSHFWTTTSSSH